MAAVAFAFAFACRPIERGPLFFGAGATTPHRGGTLHVAWIPDLRTLDPAIAYDGMSNSSIRLLFDSLVAYDEGTRIVPSLAESWTLSDDAKTYRFLLHRGVRFQNGRELTADDVRYSLERLFDPATASPGAEFFRYVRGAAAMQSGQARHAEGIRVLGPYEIQIDLVQPDMTFLNLLALTFASIVPREEVERWGAEFTRHPVGTGPFRLASWDRGQRVVFDRNPGYFRAGEPYLDRIDAGLNVSRDTQFLQFENGDLDNLDRFTPADYLFVKSNRLWRPYLLEEPLNDTGGSLMNTAIPPFTDRRVRIAFNHALNKRNLSRLRNGRIVPANGFLPPRIPGYDPNLRGYAFDPARARQLLREAGFPNGFDVDYYMLGPDEAGKMYAESLQHDLAAIGVRVHIRTVSFPLLQEATGRNQLAFAYTEWSQDYPDPSDFLEVKFHSRNITRENATNDTAYRNPEVDRLLDQARGERDPARRLGLYHEAEQIVVADAPWIFEYHAKQSEMIQPWVKGYAIHPVWYRDFRRVWLDLPLRRAHAEDRRAGSPLLPAIVQGPLGFAP